MLFHQLTLLLSLVSQHGTESDISNTLDALGGSVELVVNDDTSALVHLDTNLVKTKTLSHGSSTDSNEDDIGLDL